jgi:uncharacterized protein with GYD domain
MARYMSIAHYASDGARGPVKSGATARRTAIQTMATQLGGRMESFDFAFGADDVFTEVRP